MSLFWIIAVLFILVGLLVLLRPFIKKGDAVQDNVDQSAMNLSIAKDRLVELDKDFEDNRINEKEHKEIKEELESALYFDLENQTQKLGDDNKGKWGLVVILLFVPILTVSMYQSLGSPEGMKLVPGQRVEPVVQAPVAPPSIKETLIQLVESLKKSPEDVDAWLAMGGAMMRIDRYQEAIVAFNKALTFSDFVGTPKADILVSLADAVAMGNGGSLEGEPDELIAKALTLDANHTSGLWLAGMSAERKGNHEVALSHWNRLYPMLSDADGAKQNLEILMMDAENAMEGLPTSAQQMTASISANLTLYITISDEMKAQTTGDELLFIYAKAMSGPPMPLAALKLKVSDLPTEVTLDDSMAMLPQMRLSSFDTVIVGARISKSGQPISQPGDLQGEVSNVTVQNNTQVINVLISEVLK